MKKTFLIILVSILLCSGVVGLSTYFIRVNAAESFVSSSDSDNVLEEPSDGSSDDVVLLSDVPYFKNKCYVYLSPVSNDPSVFTSFIDQYYQKNELYRTEADFGTLIRFYLEDYDKTMYELKIERSECFDDGTLLYRLYDAECGTNFFLYAEGKSISDIKGYSLKQMGWQSDFFDFAEYYGTYIRIPKIYDCIDSIITSSNDASSFYDGVLKEESTFKFDTMRVPTLFLSSWEARCHFYSSEGLDDSFEEIDGVFGLTCLYDVFYVNQEDAINSSTSFSSNGWINLESDSDGWVVVRYVKLTIEVDGKDSEADILLFESNINGESLINVVYYHLYGNAPLEAFTSLFDSYGWKYTKRDYRGDWSASIFDMYSLFGSSLYMGKLPEMGDVAIRGIEPTGYGFLYNLNKDEIKA